MSASRVMCTHCGEAAVCRIYNVKYHDGAVNGLEAQCINCGKVFLILSNNDDIMMVEKD